MFDIKRARKETRGCENVTHFNNAGAALMPTCVSDTLHHYLNKEEQIGGYETYTDEQQILNGFYHSTARLLNCKTHEVAFVENATRAWDMAFYGFKFSPGDKILTTLAEYGSNVIAYLQQVKRYGIEIVFVPNDASGQIDLTSLKNLIDDKVKLISITHIPTCGGLVNPAQAVGKIAKSVGIPFLLDGCQSIGHIPIDVDAIGCDIVCGTGRKYLRGPRGTGLLYVNERLIDKLEPPLLDIHAAELVSNNAYTIRKDAKRFENWEQNFAGKAALKTAIDYDLSAIQSRIYYLAELLRNKLNTIDGVNLMDEGVEKCGIVTFSTEQLSADVVQQMLSKKHINTSVSEGSSSFISFQKRGLNELVRASLHYYNTEAEIDYFIDTLQTILKK